mmetsp:Transcript_34163/g.42242  ORF Transcript_34163/g.42242 Transcript_34163/m.42242 type:complete len:427 (-) Transcript_34163:33-1313(-)
MEQVAHLSQKLVDLAHRAQIFNIVCLARQVVRGDFLDRVGLLSCVGLGADDTAVGERVVHRKFLLQLANLFLVPFDEQDLISLLIDMRHVLDLLHARSEAQSGESLLKVMRLRPHISDQNGVAIATDGTLEQVSKLALAVRHVLALLISRAHDDLLEEGERAVDIAGLAHGHTSRAGLLGTLIASQIDQVEFGGDNLLVLLNSRPALNMNREDSVRARRIHIQVVVACSALLLSLEQAVKSLFFVAALSRGKAANGDLTQGVLLDGHARASLLSWARLGEHIKHELIVDLDEGNLDSDLIVETAAHFGENLVDGARNQASVLVVGRGAAHREGLACAGLTVAKDSPVEAIDDFVDGLLRAVLEDLLLRSVMQELIEFECPLLLLIVHHTPSLIFCHRNGNRLGLRVDVDVLGGEVRSGPGANHHLD